jgi:hypothetical protein
MKLLTVIILLGISVVLISYLSILFSTRLVSVNWSATYCLVEGCPPGGQELNLSATTRNTTCPPSADAVFKTHDRWADDVKQRYYLKAGSCQITKTNSQ